MRRGVPLLIAGGLAALLLAGLGAWQLQRLAWKTDLIAQLEARGASAPAPPPAALDDPASLEAWAWRPAVLPRATLRLDRPIFWRRTQEGRLGFATLALAERPDGAPVLVDLGWREAGPGFRPSALSDPGPRQVEGLTGRLRPLPEENPFLPDSAPGTEVTARPDPVAIAAELGAARPLTLLLTADPSPLADHAASPVVPRLRNEHASYAAFWFSMSAALVAVTALRWRQLRR